MKTGPTPTPAVFGIPNPRTADAMRLRLSVSRMDHSATLGAEFCAALPAERLALLGNGNRCRPDACTMDPTFSAVVNRPDPVSRTVDQFDFEWSRLGNVSNHLSWKLKLSLSGGVDRFADVQRLSGSRHSQQQRNGNQCFCRSHDCVLLLRRDRRTTRRTASSTRSTMGIDCHVARFCYEVLSHC